MKSTTKSKVPTFQIRKRRRRRSGKATNRKPPVRPPVIPLERYDGIVKAYTLGHSVAAIAAHLGCGEESVRRVLALREVPRRTGIGRGLSDAQRAEIVRRYEAKETTYALAEAFHICRETVRKIVAAAGKPVRDRRDAAILRAQRAAAAQP